MANSDTTLSGEHALASAPQAARPDMPDYGISADADGLLPWQHVSEQMAAARNYWIGTVRPDGRPHATPVWGVWVDETFYFGMGPRSVKARNLAANPALVVHLESGDDVVVLEGVAEFDQRSGPGAFRTHRRPIRCQVQRLPSRAAVRRDTVRRASMPGGVWLAGDGFRAQRDAVDVSLMRDWTFLRR